MTTYRYADGREILVCDTCGIGTDGDKPDLTGAVPLDFTDEMRRLGFPPGTAMKVKDTCPGCEKVRKAAERPL